jgi:hypothetical protein
MENNEAEKFVNGKYLFPKSELAIFSKCNFCVLLREYADQEVAKATENTIPLDDVAQFIADAIERGKQNDKEPENVWVNECPKCKKEYDYHDYLFGHRCKPTQTPVQIPCRRNRSRKEKTLYPSSF